MVRSANAVFAGAPVGSAGKLLPDGNYTPYFSLANFSINAAHVTIQYATGLTGSARQVADLMVPAKSSKELALDILQGDPNLRNSFIVVADGSSPGDLMAKFVSRSESNLRGVELLGKDEKATSNGSSHPWSLEEGTESTLMLFNYSKEEQKFSVMVSTPGVLWQKIYTLSSMRTDAINVRDLIENKVKDDDGKTLPKSAMSGEIDWSNANPGKGAGRLLQSNRDLAMARSFSCTHSVVLCFVHITVTNGTFLVDTTVDYATARGYWCVERTFGSCSGPSATGRFASFA